MKLDLCEIEAAGRRLHCGSARLPLAHEVKVGNSQEIGKCSSGATVLRASAEEDCVISALLCSALLALTPFAQAFRMVQIDSGYTVPPPPTSDIQYKSAVFPFIFELNPRCSSIIVL